MHESTSASPPEAQGRTRGLFPRRSGTASPTAQAPRDPAQTSLELLVDERLEDGMRGIQEQATALMREIATEMWRASAADVRPEQERIISLLSRDQAIRSLIASSDERFQSLVVRTASLEDSLAATAESSRSMRDSLAESARVVHEAANSPMLQGVEAVREQLAEVDQRITQTMAFLDERERALTDGIQQQVVAHGDLITQETSRIVEAMQGYVQGGVEAVGQLAQRVDAQIQMFGGLDDTALDRVRETVRDEIESFAGRSDHVDERFGLQGRQILKAAEELQAVMQARIYGLAQLVRSDSEAIRGLIEQMGEHQASAVREAIGDALSGMAAQTREALVGHAAATQERMERVEHLVGERVEAISDELVATVDREMAMLSDRIDSKLTAVADAVNRVGDPADLPAETAERLARHVDDRLTALAKMIRSDNRILGERMSTMPAGSAGDGGADSARLALRAVKELQASLAGDVMGSMDHRFQSMADQLHKETQSTAEAMVKVAEVMGQKIDRLSVRIDEGYGNDIQIVIDRMGDAIQAMSGRVRREEPFDV
ncbi:MAG: hypothetical protein ABJC60_10605 [Actinomycetota bacterium]